MVFDSKSQSEDCLYLNIWTPAKKMNEKLPVLIYFNGGGLVAGSGSEPRYQGLRLARRGNIIVVTANYREGIFGFFSLPELSKEGCHGDQGWLDQAAAVQEWRFSLRRPLRRPRWRRESIRGRSSEVRSLCLRAWRPWRI